MIVKGGSTDVTAYFQMRLTAGGDGTGLTIADFDLTYTRSGDTPAAKADAVALAAANTAHTDNRGIEVDPTDAPGLYRFDFPDAAFAASVREVILTIKHADCFTESLRVEIQPLVDIADVVWDEARSGHTTQGTYGESFSTVVSGTVNDANTSPTTTVFAASDITEATADHFIGRTIIFTTGDLQYQATDITDYALVSGEGRFTVTALTSAPADGDQFVII
jgi:hypothetical protein